MADRLQTRVLILVIALAGCASVDLDYPRTESHTLPDTGDTWLGQRAIALTAGQTDRSGFVLQLDGIDALATRILLAARGEKTIDAQYYLIASDPAADLFVESLLRAADRGVRVRLLLDDIQTQGYDAGMAALDAHPNFEIRIFNPFARGARSLNAARDFSRVNRRMHNKTFTVDNAITIIGGRNIAAEYFAARDDVNFGDMDAVAIGPVVAAVSAQFDEYWNDEYAVPVPAFVDMPDDLDAALQSVRDHYADTRAHLEETRYTEVLTRSVNQLIDEEADFAWAPAQLVHDAPGKAREEALHGDDSILTSLREAIDAGQRELIIVSPYFVPTDSTIDKVAELRARGMEIIVITNSLASNNHAVVHSGYAPTRKPLLKHGVRLYETRADARVVGTERASQKYAEGTLHTKAFIVDREVLFLGSFNFDPRSAYINTELGVIIESAQLAGWAATRIDDKLDATAYEVILDEKNRLRWIERGEGGDIVHTKEPETSFWTRAKVNMMRLLPIKGQL
jgi:putative cardiolipin synthase